MFVEVSWERPTLEGISFEVLLELDRASLEEMKEAVWESDGDKCSGLNGPKCDKI